LPHGRRHWLVEKRQVEVFDVTVRKRRGRSVNGYKSRKSAADAEFDFVDIKDFNLPLLDEPVPRHGAIQ